MKVQLDEIPRYISLIFVTMWIGFTFVLFGWLVVSSFKSTAEIYGTIWALPKVWRIGNYVKALTSSGLLRYLFNSLLVVSAATILVLIVSGPIAYTLSRLRFKGSSFISFGIVLGIAVPIQSIFIPLYLIMKDLKLVNSLIGLVILYVVTEIAFTVYILMGFFKTIPSELDDAACIDGATAFQSFIKVMVPVASAGFISAAIFNFVMLWKEFLLALIFITTLSKVTVSLGLYSLVQSLTYVADWGTMFAGIIIVVVPSVIFYSLVARKFVSGITAGMGKG